MAVATQAAFSSPARSAKTQAVSPVLPIVAEAITPWQRVSGPALAVTWSRSDHPPLEADKIGFYAAAFPMSTGDTRTRIARCLVWCDAEVGQHCPARLEAYQLAFATFPNDDRVAFFVAALCEADILTDPATKKAVFACITAPNKVDSPLYRRYRMKPDRILLLLARLYAADTDTLLPDQVAVVERVLDAADESSPDRVPFANYLATAYRSFGRQDTTAEIVYRFLFLHMTHNAENNAFLARIYHEHQRRDANACAIYARMVTQCEAEGSHEESHRWTMRLAQTYLALNRADLTTLPVYEKARGMAPADRHFEAAYLASFVRRTDLNIDAVPVLENALQAEPALRPLFEVHRWQWPAVVRALALLYGQESRADAEAIEQYAAATTYYSEDRDLWKHYATALALNDDLSEKAVGVYEKATHGSQTEEALLMMLANAYLHQNAYEGPHREKALTLWETLYRGGQATLRMVEALAKAYTIEERVNDVALMLWEKAVTDDPKNAVMQLRLGQELRARSEFEKALPYMKSAAKLLPKSFAAQYETATLLISQTADYPAAIRLLQKAIKLTEGVQHLGAHFALGEAFLARDKREEAKAIFEKIIADIDPNHTETLLRLARLSLKYEEAGVKQAEALYDKALNLNPEHPETYRKMADLYRERGQSDDEQNALEKYLSLCEPDADKYRQLADLYIRRNDFARAEVALRQVITLGNADKQTYILLGEVILQARKSEKKQEAKIEVEVPKVEEAPTDKVSEQDDTEE